VAAAGSRLPAASEILITAADVTADKVGRSIPVSAIGEPVSAVNLSEPRWVEDANGGYGVVDGEILPVDPKGKPINFRVALPAKWARRGLQLGGGGMNGMIPGVTGADVGRGFATYGSDSGHQAGGFGGPPRGGAGGPPRAGGFPGAGPGGPGAGPGGRGAGGAGPPVPGAGPPAAGGRPPAPATAGGPPAAPRGGPPGGGPPRGAPPGGAPGAGNDWALNDEAIRNLGYMQMKKTHDAAMVIIERVYGERPRFNYYIGGSQGGREALTVAQRYPADYDGIIADVP